MYYNLNKVLSYGAFLNVLIGERGVGKTYSVTKFVTKEFIKKGHEFAYIRRYKTELSKSAPSFFNALINNDEFKGHTLVTKGSKFLIDDKVAGYSMTLSTAQNLKSTNYPNVKYLIFDEFIIETGQNHYLKNEVDIFLGLIETIARMRDVKVFLLGNAVSITNPYFIYFDLTLPYNNEIKTFKDGLILVNYMSNLHYREEKKKTKFGKLISGTDYESYSIENRFQNDNKDFILHKTGTAKCNFSIIYNEFTFGVWQDFKEGKYFISNDYDKNGMFFACTTSDHKPNTMMLSLAKDYHFMKTFIKNYRLGNVYYENVKIKNTMQQVMKSLLRSA